MTEPFATVVLRTQGRRPRGLAQALAGLAAQDEQCFEVRLAVHDAQPAGERLVRATLDAVGSRLRSKIDVLDVRGGGRTAPLNAALGAATGEYVTFLDDDDLVEPEWLSAFAAGARLAPGTVVRARCAEQEWRGDPVTGDPIEPAGHRGEPWATTFDLLLHIHHNETPICSFALPREPVRRAGLRFDERLPVLEDWDLLMRCAFAFGVTDVDECTSLYRRISTGTSRDVHDDDVWADTIPVVRRWWEEDGLALPAGWATTLALAYETEVKLREATAELGEAVGRLQHENGELRARVHAVEASRWWRLTKPMRVVSGLLRGS
jgi:hypothetical protein